MAEQQEEQGTEKAPLIVAIGASAGGVQALQSFFSGIPSNTGAAFMVVVHLDPEHRSELASVLAARTQMPVTQVEEKSPSSSMRGSTKWRGQPAARRGPETQNSR
jgi:chemotaxis response regulator CheB